jgi:muramoyltetrapeptide carboxypeptidase
MPFLKQTPIVPGMTIGIIAPSRYPADQVVFEVGVGFLRVQGFKVVVHPQCGLRWHQFAGREPEKVQAFHDMLLNPEIDAIMAAAGGNRTLHMLEHIDWDLVRAHPKPLIGYSDITGLQIPMLTQAGIGSFYGPVVTNFGRPLFQQSAFCQDSFLHVLAGESYTYLWPEDAQPEILCSGEGEGTLVGGNLCLLANLVGTRFAPDFENTILFFEDEKEDICNIDRMLLLLRRAGRNIDKIKGVLVGGFTELSDKSAATVPYGLTLRDLMLEHFGDLGVPVVFNAPFGHGGHLPTLPIGRKARIKAGEETVILKLI